VTKALPGEVADPEPDFKKHKWEGGWLNGKVCKVCGCEDISGINASGRGYTYRDCQNKLIESFKELPCPVFVGDASSAIAEAKETVRRVKVEAKQADTRITQLESDNRALMALAGRVTQLEAENKALREDVGSVKQIDLNELAAILLKLTEDARGRKALESVETKGGVRQIPKELVDVIDVVGVVKELPPAED